MRQRTVAILLVLVTALPRLVALLYERSSIVDDFTEKGDVFAKTLLDHGTYGFIPGHPSAYTQPLYGWFLVPLYWVFGRSWEVVGLAQIAVACATTLIVWRIGRRWLSPAVGLLAALAVAVHPYLVWHDVHMNREILDHLLAASIVYLTLLAAERFTPQVGLALGAVVGLAILSNVRLEALPLLLLAYLAIRRQWAWAGAVAVLAGCALVVMPWVVRNAANVGCWTVTTDARALWKANNVNTYATLKSGQWIDHVPQPASFPPTPQDVYDNWVKTGVVLPYDECAQMTMFQKKVISFWVHHPADKARLVPLDAQWLWQPNVVEVTDRPGAGTWLDTMRQLAEPAYMIVIYALALVGLYVVPRAFGLFAVLLLAYQTLVAMLFVGETRYRVPWDFVTTLLAAAGAVWLLQTYRERRARRIRTAT